MFRRIRTIAVGLALVILHLLSIAASAQEPIVYGVFFYSPTCPHCHEVINNHWPGIQETFGDQLRVLFIDVSGPAGAQIMHETRQAMNIESGGVPMLIIGSEVLIGSIDIPQNAPGVIRTGLAVGGIALPPIPAVQDAYKVAIAQYEAQRTQQDSAATTEISASAGETTTILQRLQADPVANAAAIVILALLVCSLVVITFALTQHDKRPLPVNGGRLERGVLTVLALVGMALTLSLVAGATRDTAVMVLAGGELLLFLVLVVALIRTHQMPNWLLPLTAFAGLAVAAYMTHVEVNMTEAVCGTVGNCNLVQQSPYARVLNIPIGVIGIGGYIGMIVIWGLSQMNERRWLKWTLIGMAFVGTAFSAYLTFLEPFVIGASCAWCLTSAVLMLILLWITVMPESRATSPSTAVART